LNPSTRSASGDQLSNEGVEGGERCIGPCHLRSRWRTLQAAAQYAEAVDGGSSSSGGS